MGDKGGSQGRNLVVSPAFETLMRFEAELSVSNQFFQIRTWRSAVFQIGKNSLVNVERQIGADKIGILQRPEHGKPRAKAVFHHKVDGCSVTHAIFDQRYRLAPQGALQAVAEATFKAHRQPKQAGIP